MHSLAQGGTHGLLDRPHQGRGHGAEFHGAAEFHPAAVRGRVDAQSDGGEEGVGVRVDELGGLPRAGRPFQADGRGPPEDHVHAELLGQGRLDDLLLHLPVEREGHLPAEVVAADGDQRVLFGETAERGVQGAPVLGASRDDDRLQGRRGEVPASGLGPVRADAVADPDAGRPLQPADPAGADRRSRHLTAVLENADRRDLALALLTVRAAETQYLAGVHGPPDHTDVRGPLAVRGPVDLEHRAPGRRLRVPRGGGQQSGDAVDQGVDARAGGGGAEEDRVDAAPGGLFGQRPEEPGVGETRRVVDVRAQQLVVVPGEQVGERTGEAGIGPGERGARRGPGAEVPGGAHRDDVRGEPFGDARQQRAVPCAGPVGLVDEQQGRDAQSAQGAQQDAGLRLDALHRGHDQDGSVEHAEDPLHLGDEVRVAGGVDQVDRGGAEGEGDDGGLDGDAASALQGEGVGLCAAVVDAADGVDGSGGVEEPLGQACLTGVDMRQDSQVQRVHGASCP
ncbi:hypothetical protein ASD97_35090 [Streptomyces sp. Root63]|nr:hypothetical protein ASD97_35090 [Streptomyces sp. Root63]